MAPEPETAEPGRDPSEAPEPTTPKRRRRGCLHGLFRMTRTTFVILLIILGAGWYWLENGSIGEFIGDKISHCGINQFNLVRTDAGWKIANGASTMNPADCNEKEKAMKSSLPKASQE